MTEFVVDHAGRRYRVELDQHHIVVHRVDDAVETPLGHLTLEAAAVLAQLPDGE